MSTMDLIQRDVEVDDEEDDEPFDEETGDVRPKANGLNGSSRHFNDSSEEEEEDDDDEEAAREVCNILGSLRWRLVTDRAVGYLGEGRVHCRRRRRNRGKGPTTPRTEEEKEGRARGRRSRVGRRGSRSDWRGQSRL